MLLIIIVVLGLVVVAMTVGLDSLFKVRFENYFGTFLGIAVVCFIVALIIGVVTLVTYPTSLNRIAKLENFYDRNNAIYGESVKLFPDAVVVETSNDTTKMVKLSWDYVQGVLEYNQNLCFYRLYQNHWFMGVFISEVPARLKYISIKK